MSSESTDHGERPGGWGLVVVAWAMVSIPLLWGVLMTFRKAMLLFSH